MVAVALAAQRAGKMTLSAQVIDVAQTQSSCWWRRCRDMRCGRFDRVTVCSLS